ncbi:hypothetical protein NPX13_g3416 [Xylaria arbuscula]|uniref:Uncharacterized protein n=1 Tax=Xylaria arbuscula TaxID=114810 RepID=A0A9W8NIS6_9PEZI|nr:hypothetical protein NPX13_g3416 [Xylaria arbuscula]
MSRSRSRYNANYITNTAAYRILCSSTISSIEAYEIPLTYVTRLPGRDDGPRTLTKTETPMYAPMYRLNWHNSDRPVSASTHHTIDITSPPVQPTTTETRKGFTKDAKIGIIVGATAGGLVLIAFLAWIARSIRRAKKTPSRPKVPTRNELFGQIDARGSSGNQPYELD